MQITKLGHCCLLIEINGKRILTDPGRFSTSQNTLLNIDIILITHEHADHFHTESIKVLVESNPKVQIITNSSVGALLNNLNIPFQNLEGLSESEVEGVHIAAFDGKHEEIFEEYGQVQNTGYFIAGKLFYPGDAYIDIGRPVPVLALPIAGPWCKLSEAVRYALEIKPNVAFPVHDATLNDDGLTLTHGLFKTQLESKGISFTPLRTGESAEF
jgi:L-ascorbate metabolism protein UlaG (beta-lactamase superfamily)